MNNMLGVFGELKKKSGVKFYICKGVKKETVDDPLKSKKWKFGGIQVTALINDGNLEVYDGDLGRKTEYLLGLANNIFVGSWIDKIRAI